MTCRILFVCLGNICRSPAAEGVFLKLLESRGLGDGFAVDSAGTGAWHAGERADPRMRAAAAERGITLQSIARQITSRDLEGFDHILTMDDDNLKQTRLLDPSGRRHHRIRPLAPYCRHHRVDAIPDPYTGGREGFEHVLDLLEDACDTLLTELVAPPRP
jgi:protein-tyrosine phosphatase